MKGEPLLFWNHRSRLARLKNQPRLIRDQQHCGEIAWEIFSQGQHTEAGVRGLHPKLAAKVGNSVRTSCMVVGFEDMRDHGEQVSLGTKW